MFSFFFTTAPLTCYLFHPLVLQSHFFPSSSLFLAQEILFAIIFSVTRRGRKARTPYSWVPPPKAHSSFVLSLRMCVCFCATWTTNNGAFLISVNVLFSIVHVHTLENCPILRLSCALPLVRYTSSYGFKIPVERMKEFFNKNLGFWKIRNSRGYWSAVTEQHNRQMCGPFYFPLSSIKSICNVLSNCPYISQCMCAPSLLCFLR